MASAHVQRKAEALAAISLYENAALRGGATGVGVDQGVGHLGELNTRSAVTLTLDVCAGAFEQKEELIGQSIRFEISGIGTKLRQPAAVVVLALLDDDARGMALVRKFDGRIRHRTAAVILP